MSCNAPTEHDEYGTCMVNGISVRLRPHPFRPTAVATLELSASRQFVRFLLAIRSWKACSGARRLPPDLGELGQGFQRVRAAMDHVLGVQVAILAPVLGALIVMSVPAVSAAVGWTRQFGAAGLDEAKATATPFPWRLRLAWADRRGPRRRREWSFAANQQDLTTAGRRQC
jgi:hypothetical protein